MELIKQIKQAEAESKQIIEQAKAESAQMIAASAAKGIQEIKEAGLKRNEIIEKVVNDAKAQGMAQAQQLKTQAEQTLEALRNKANERSESAVAKIAETVKKRPQS